MKKIVFLIFFSLYFFCSIIQNILNQEEKINKLFYQTEEVETIANLLQRNKYIYKSFNFISDYSGAETGFGLYAPNVSSQLVIYYTIRDENGVPVKTVQPRFGTKEIAQRFFTVYGNFLEKTKPKNSLDENKLYDEYLDLVVKSMTFKTLQENNSYRSIDADIYVYDIPLMEDYRKGETPAYRHLFHYEYELEKIEK